MLFLTCEGFLELEQMDSAISVERKQLNSMTHQISALQEFPHLVVARPVDHGKAGVGSVLAKPVEQAATVGTAKVSGKKVCPCACVSASRPLFRINHDVQRLVMHLEDLQ